jgi:hypothetical protein
LARRKSGNQKEVKALVSSLKEYLGMSEDESNSNAKSNNLQRKLTFLIAVYNKLVRPVGEYFSIKQGGRKIKKKTQKPSKPSKPKKPKS